jgi:N-acetylglucosamine malate deacetylase 2
MTRRQFSLLLGGAAASTSIDAQEPLKILVVVAHPDDEYAFAATIYRIAREIGGIVDQVIISNGEAGYRYSAPAEQIYGLHLTDEQVGRANLPEIRKQESLAAGRILGIRQHHFLDQKDSGFTLDPESVNADWDKQAIRKLLARLLLAEKYTVVFTLLPTADTHGQHKAATLLALEAAASLPADRRPVIFGVEPASGQDRARKFTELSGYPMTRTESDVHEFQRSSPFGFRDALNYQIIVNWVIAAHKSQGLFQMDAGRHDLERFWLFEASGQFSQERAQRFFERLEKNVKSAARQESVTHR